MSNLKFNISIHPWNHHHNQESFWHPLWSSSLTAPCFPHPQETTGWSAFCLNNLHFLDLYVNGTVQYAVFCVWLLSLSLIIFRSIHVIEHIKSSFLFIRSFIITLFRKFKILIKRTLNNCFKSGTMYTKIFGNCLQKWHLRYISWS